jgi:hypothetical protein
MLLSLNNSRFGDFVDRIYPIELKIKDTTDQVLIVRKLENKVVLNEYFNIAK